MDYIQESIQEFYADLFEMLHLLLIACALFIIFRSIFISIFYLLTSCSIFLIVQKRPGSHTFVEIDHEIISTVILLPSKPTNQQPVKTNPEFACL